MTVRDECVPAGGQAPRVPVLQAGSLGTVVPVLAASPGAGATSVAVALADAAQLRGRAVLLVDTADGARSGLARAARNDGIARPGPQGRVRMRYSWRAQALLARAETSSGMLSAADVPPPAYWLPPRHRVEITVVDLAPDAWSIATHPGIGAGAWLAPFGGGTHPVLVVRPSIPGVIHAEQVLARLDQWSRRGSVVSPRQLVVVGTRKWPVRVAASAGARLQALMPATLFLPHDPGTAVDGVTPEVTPAQVRQPLDSLIEGWLGPHDGTATRPGGSRDRRGWRRHRAPAKAATGTTS